MDQIPALGLAASIDQFTDLASTVAKRLSDFGNSIDRAPTFRQLKAELPFIVDCLRRTKTDDREGKLDNPTQGALRSVIRECHKETVRLDEILSRVTTPPARASSWESRDKVIATLSSDENVGEVAETLGKYVRALTLHQVLENSLMGGVIENQPLPVHLNAFWLVPFDRNALFVGRNSIFEEIEATFQAKEGDQPKAALDGVGGIGKSQVALEYCYRKREMDSRCSIFWVNAATVARFEESFNQIATECGLITCEDTQADTVLLVKEYLEDRHENPWLMVVDNVDDEDAFYGENMRNDKTPSQCIPHCRAGSLLFTTRTQSMAVDLARPNAPITVDEMSPEEGLRLVRRRLQGDHSEDTILELINELDYVPLAITQSVSFIVKRRKTIPQYLDEYRRHDPAITELLSGEFSDHACQRGSIESVAKTWTILFQSIRDTKPRAAELLCLLSFLQHQAIPRQLLRREDEDKSYFEDAMALLVAFSLVDKDETGTMFSMHRLVQLATRRWLENESPKEVDIWALAALKSVSTHFPAPSHMPDNDWFRLCEALLPHAELALRFQFKSPGKETELEKAKLLLHSGRYISWNGAYAECQERFKKSLDIRLKYLGEKNVDTLKSMGMVVWQRSCWNDDPGNDPAIVLMARRLLTLRRELLGDDDPDTIDALSDLATSIATTGDLGQSEGLQREALRRSERVLGRKHCDTLNCMAHLASVLEDEGKKEEALKLQREAYDGKLELLGPGHRDLLVAECNLANLMLTDQKTKEEAIGVFMRNLKGKMKAFGPDHRETLITAMNLARALKNQGQFAAAHEICQHALDKSTPRKDIERTRTHLQKLDTNIKSWMLHVKESDSDRLILASFRSKL